jgi:hypothetical protein
MDITVPAGLLRIGDVHMGQTVTGIVPIRSAPQWLSQCMEVTTVDASDATATAVTQQVNKNQLLRVTRGM